MKLINTKGFQIIKKIISVIIFFVILVYLVSKTGQFARPDDNDTDMWATYYAEDKNTIDVISKGSAQNYFDQTENYRLITEKVDNSFYPDAKYVVIAINTTQLEEATERYVKLIVIMMSFLATIYRG